jgi:hypothetical protein
MKWIKDRGLTLALLAAFAVTFVGQILSGLGEHNQEQIDHGAAPVTLAAYLGTSHMWEATLENWESEFLQMAVFVMLTVVLVQRGSPESRRPYAIEESDADPRRFAHLPDVPWPVRRGGLWLRLYEYSLGLTFGLLFLLSWSGHAVAGWRAYDADERLVGRAAPAIADFLGSSRFWFESMQNWQSEFLSIAAMVWLSVYLRHRGSPESKPVHAAHHETGR